MHHPLFLHFFNTSSQFSKVEHEFLIVVFPLLLYTIFSLTHPLLYTPLIAPSHPTHPSVSVTILSWQCHTPVPNSMTFPSPTAPSHHMCSQTFHISNLPPLPPILTSPHLVVLFRFACHTKHLFLDVFIISDLVLLLIHCIN